MLVPEVLLEMNFKSSDFFICIPIQFKGIIKSDPKSFFFPEGLLLAKVNIDMKWGREQVKRKPKIERELKIVERSR